MKIGKLLSVFFTVLLALLTVGGGIAYVLSVRDSLWTRSTVETLEVTQKGAYALDVYLEKDKDVAESLGDKLRLVESSDSRSIMTLIQFPTDDNSSFTCIDLFEKKEYCQTHNVSGEILDAAEYETIKDFPSSGIRMPYFNSHTGVRQIAVYQRFVFKDGVDGIVFKTQNVDDLVDRFTLSYYENSGFSYVVDNEGNILIRPTHRNSNRTFQNIFEIIDFEQNNHTVLDDFALSLKNGKRGIAGFSYSGEEYVFCYVPLEQAEGWYVVAVIPNAVIMAEVNDIISRTMLLLVMVVLCLLSGGAFVYAHIKRHHKEVETVAYYDQLTGLYRYGKFLEEGEKYYRRGDRLAVFYINVIGFKLVNDRKGYEYGDTVLRRLADIIKNEISENDAACREAGDDFLLAVHLSDRTEAETLGRSIASKLSDKDAVLKLSIGVCESETAHAEYFSGLVDRARIAERDAPKQGGVFMRFYTHAMREQLLRTAEIEGVMNEALANGEFVYFVQAKYSADGRRIVGGEALVRWKKPDGTFVSPGEFIPLFERNGFVRQLDENIYRAVADDMGRRIRCGKPVVPVSVNVSRVSLYRSDFVETYSELKEKNNIGDGLLELEFTESAMLEDPGRIIDTCSELRRRGFVCSIDDFGSGYSSLNVLKDMPVDVLKLDRKFLEESGAMNRKEAIVKSVVDMAKQLSMNTVAEGVETREQLEFVRKMGCDVIQGFIFARPVAAEEFYGNLQSMPSGSDENTDK